MNAVDLVLDEIRQRIVPTRKDEEKIRELQDDLIGRVEKALRKHRVRATVSPQGSVVKGTWLRDDVDVDIFVLFPTSVTKEGLANVGLKVAREAMRGFEQIHRYAEHPYLECMVPLEGTKVRVDVVPCYHVERGRWLSATDRTPYHTRYVLKRLRESASLGNEIRCTKAFLRGLGVYGAEIRVQGFSGYACELLTIHFGSFLGLLNAASKWRGRETVDVEGHYSGREKELRERFDPVPLILVDPVDPKRNVAAALSRQSLGLFVAGARGFLERPDGKFFFPTVPSPTRSREELAGKIEAIGGNILFLRIGKVNTRAPDVLWGQLYKTRDAIRALLEEFDFRVHRTWVWSDEKEHNVLAFKLESLSLSETGLRRGPPVHMKSDSDRFLKKSMISPTTVFGPWIDKGRWVIECKRKYVKARDLLMEKLREGGEELGVAKLVAMSLRQGFEVLTDEGVWDLYRSDKEFASALTCFLVGKPPWLL